MIETLINRAIDNRWIILGLTLILVGFGLFAAVHLPVDAYPDISPQKAWIVTSYPGRAAEEVERQITIPIEIALRTLPKMLDMRSDTIFGLSAVYVVFEDGVTPAWARGQVYERLNQVELPVGAGVPELVPDTSACGEIYRYELTSDGSVDTMELRTLNEWVVIPALYRAPGVAGAYNFGGLEKRYSVIFRPAQLLRYNLSLADVIDALEKNNISGGGGILPRGSMELVIRGTGVIENPEQIKDVFIKSIDGTPVFVKDVASVEVDFTTPWSIYSRDKTDEGVEGVVQMRRGENPSTVLRDLKKIIAQLNEDLPDGVEIVTIYDRQDLVDSTIGTVSHSVSIGITLVLFVLLLFLGRPLMALIVALTIPFSLLFALGLMYLTDIPIGLLSIGAIDFGIIVDGAVIMADAIARRLGASGTKKPKEVLEVIRTTALDMYKPVFVSMSLIMMAFLPLLSLTRIEGLLFRPMAFTIVYALMGALIFALFIAPVLAYFFFRWGYRDWDSPLLKLVTPIYIRYIKLIMKARYIVATVAVAGLIVLLCELVPKLGVEFLPYMDEGSIWIRSQFPEGMSLQKTHECGRHIRQMIREEFPDISIVSVQVGRADDSEPYTASRMELMIILKPQSQWKQFKTKHELKDALGKRLREEYPTTAFSFSQVILDQVIDDTNGTSAQLAIEISGPDSDVLLDLALKTKALVESVRGAIDTAIEQPGPQAQLKIEPDRRLCARYNVKIEDVVQVINVAMGGEPIGVLYEGEQRFDIAAKFDRSAMASPQAIGRLPVFNEDGVPIPLIQVTNISVADGQTIISRTDGRRRLTVRTNVSGRDEGGFVAEVQRRFEKEIELPPGYRDQWCGMYENLERAYNHFMLIIPITVGIIFSILVFNFGSVRAASVLLLPIPFAFAAGALALYLRGMNMNVSTGVGFATLFGIAAMDGVLMFKGIHRYLKQGFSVEESVIRGRIDLLRVSLMASLVAILGLLPASLATSLGSDVQRPLATVIVWGLTGSTLFTLFVTPVFYRIFITPLSQTEMEEEDKQIDVTK